MTTTSSGLVVLIFSPVSIIVISLKLVDGERVNRADFGLTWNQMGMASMNNTLTIHAVFIRR